MLLITYGFRRAEVLKLQISDVRVNGREPTLTIVRRPGEAVDPRGIEPAVKTFGREVPLLPPMARLLHQLIVSHRPQFPNTEQSPFLFFSAKGNPLLVREINEITKQIVNRDPEFAGLLPPHILRYTFNDDFERTLRLSRMSPEQIKQARNYMNGWSAQSNQGDLYARREIEKQAREISLKHQRPLFE